jgi:hypothetical protein
MTDWHNTLTDDARLSNNRPEGTLPPYENETMTEIHGNPYLPAQMHSDTSIAAAEAALPNAGTQRWHVLELLRAFPDYGMTDEEIQDALDMNPSAERPRRIELVNAGLVIDSGERRETSSGRKATVWRAA